jgi:hypothetical protein
MQTMTLILGERVLIVGGIYKCHHFGTYVGPYGNKMATVKVDGNLKESRNVRLTSIEPFPPHTLSTSSSTRDKTITMPWADYDALQNDIDNLMAELRKLQL